MRQPDTRAAASWVAATLRALFPPISRQRLAFRGGGFALPIYLVLVLIYPISLQQAEWVETSGQFTWIAVAAVFFGTLIGNGRLTTRRAFVVGGVVGVVAVVAMTAAASEGGIFRDKVINLAVQVNNWITQVLAGEAAHDPTVFILFLASSTWSAAFIGSFVLARTIRVWDAIIFNGFCLVVNVSMALTNLIGDLVVYSLAVLVLLVRLHLVQLHDRWSRQNIVPTGEMDWRLIRGGLTWSLVFVMMALFTPRVGAAEVLSRAYDVFQSPYQRIETEWQRFFAGVSGPSRLRGVSFTDSIRLGQSPALNDVVVMTVDAPQGRFWRAVTYDFYTGNGWRATETDHTDKITPPTAGREKFEATFDVASPIQSLLFAPNEPVKASIPFQFDTGADRTYSTSMSALRGTNADHYVITSYVSTADKALLRRASTDYSAYIKQKYLQLPSTLPQRVRDLAHRVAGAEPDPYDKAETIEAYLRTAYRYTPTVKPPPAGRDPVDYFLFDLKEDFCEYFSSSMVVMLRELGVPARIVEGYTSGTLDVNTGKFVVRELDAHAWVEAYIPNYGWVEFEPTPSQSPFIRTDADLTGGSINPDELPGDGSNSLTRDDSQGLGQTEVPGVSEGFTGAMQFIVQEFDPRPFLFLLALIFALIALAVVRFQLRFRGFARIDAAWGKARLLATYVGYAPHQAQTTYEYAAMLGEAVPDAQGPIQDIAEARVRDRYSPGGASDAEVDRASSAWGRLMRTLLRMLPARVGGFLRQLTR